MRTLFFCKGVGKNVETAIMNNLKKRDMYTDFASDEPIFNTLLLKNPDLVIIACKDPSLACVTRGRTDAPIMYIGQKKVNFGESRKVRIWSYETKNLGEFYVDLSLFHGRIEAKESL